MNEDDIRAALAEEAANAVPGSVVVERLRAPARAAADWSPWSPRAWSPRSAPW
ncbi:hypothetical protein ACFQV2_24090 [Actinokineospora soli]|uniref:Uncharacterized protein n=1 Tax=Actinokineospora soli TaxID=1048753 RepID=A0ABW2TQM4_9PSEU